MTTTTKTPGFNCRIAIFFQSDKNGRKCAYYWSGRLGDGRAIRMKLTEAELLVAQGQADLLPCHPLKAAMQEPEPVVEVAIEEVKVVEQEEKQAMAKTPTIETPTTAIELYNLSNAFNNMRQSTKKRAIATMLENMACEHGYIAIEGKMYHFNGDKLTRNYEESKCYWCNVVKPVLTDETITYTIVSRPTSNGIPFIARVLVPGQEVQEYDPMPSCWWMYTESDLAHAVNKQFKGAWYLKPEVFKSRVSEQVQPIAEEIETVAESLNLPVEEVAKVFAIAQEYSERKQADRKTFEAETKLETVPSYGQERRSVDSDIKQAITEVEQDEYIYVPDVVDALEDHGYANIDALRRGVVQTLDSFVKAGLLVDTGEGFYKRVLVLGTDHITDDWLTRAMDEEHSIL